MCEDIGNTPDELDHHDGECCTYACWSTEPRSVTNATTFKIEGSSRWAAQPHTVKLVANTTFRCTCDYHVDKSLYRHIEHVIEPDWRGCIEYRPIDDAEHVRELKAFSGEQGRNSMKRVSSLSNSPTTGPVL